MWHMAGYTAEKDLHVLENKEVWGYKPLGFLVLLYCYWPLVVSPESSNLEFGFNPEMDCNTRCFLAFPDPSSPPLPPISSGKFAHSYASVSDFWTLFFSFSNSKTYLSLTYIYICVCIYEHWPQIVVRNVCKLYLHFLESSHQAMKLLFTLKVAHVSKQGVKEHAKVTSSK